MLLCFLLVSTCEWFFCAVLMAFNVLVVRICFWSTAARLWHEFRFAASVFRVMSPHCSLLSSTCTVRFRVSC